MNTPKMFLNAAVAVFNVVAAFHPAFVLPYGLQMPVFLGMAGVFAWIAYKYWEME